MGKIVTLVAQVMDSKSLLEKLLLVPLVTLVIKIREHVKTCPFGCFGHGMKSSLEKKIILGSFGPFGHSGP